MKIKTAVVKYKGADTTLTLSPRQAIVGPVRAGKSSILQGILQAAADHQCVDPLQAVPNGHDKAEVLLKTDDGQVIRWASTLSGTGKSAKTERDGSACPEFFPQVEFGSSADQGPEKLFRNLIRRFGDESLLNTTEQALAISNDLTAEERTIWAPMTASESYPTLVDVFESLSGGNQARGRKKGEAKRRAEAAHKERKELGVTESFALAAAKKIQAAQADVDFWTRLASADLKKYGIKVKGDPEKHLSEASNALYVLEDELGPVMKFVKLSDEYREQSALARELEKQSAAASSIRAAVKRRMDDCLEAASAEFCARMKPHLPKDFEAHILSVSKGVAFGLQGPKHSAPVHYKAASGFERCAYYYALLMAWGQPEEHPPIIVLDTEDIDASNKALQWFFKKLGKAQKDGLISQVIMVAHDDRREVIPNTFKVTELQ